MEKTVEFTYGNNEEGAKELLSKLQAEQKILELFETKEIERIDVYYKKREPACTADSID